MISRFYSANLIGAALRGSCFVASSKHSEPQVLRISVGFNTTNELTVSIDSYHRFAAPYNCSTAAVVNPEDALAMARRHRIDFAELPRFISDCMASWRRSPNMGRGQVLRCFKEITENLLDERCRFRIVRTTGLKDSICC